MKNMLNGLMTVDSQHVSSQSLFDHKIRGDKQAFQRVSFGVIEMNGNNTDGL